MSENKRYISVNIDCFIDYGNAKEVVKMLKEAGFTAYDASMMTNGSMDWILYADDWQEKAKEFRAYADGLGIACNQSHAPFASAKWNDEKFNEWQFPRLVRAVQVSAILGAKVCVVHPCNDWDATTNAERIYRRLEPVAREWGVKIATENMWNCINWGTRDFLATPAACSHHDDFKAHLDILPADVFVACVDIGHAEMAGLNTSAVQMIETLGDRMEAMHLHDVDLVNDNHQIPFSQGIDFAKVMQALKNIGYKGDITLETTSDRTPKELLPAKARYLATIANYFKEQTD